ncbi:histidine phosphatase family protein [Tannockella kyphosi]|uniref:histidine phosphatase family protein n=1 Tax=Tannockella kyphosi TaxID=2899121 RepID=UPI002013905D|nr:histidine phosphatase family protein [Tannockella kyphosi]
MYIYLVRHGETEHNKQEIVQGRSDIPLNETGKQQAREVQPVFKDKSFEAMIVSPLIRTRQTGDILIEEAKVDKIVVDSRIIEKDFGVTEGIPIKERYSRYPDGHAPGEESYKIVRKRMKEAFDDYCQTYQNDILVVSHGSAIAALIKELDPTKREGRIFLKNVSITIINSETLEIEAINLDNKEAKEWYEKAKH